MVKKIFVAIVIAFSTVSISSCSSTPEVQVESAPKTGIIIESAWISATDDSGTSYVYGAITNRLNATFKLTGGRAESGAKAILTQVIDGKETKVSDGVEIHVAQTLELSETHKRLTISHLAQPISYGDKVQFTFNFKGAAPQTVVLTAK